MKNISRRGCAAISMAVGFGLASNATGSTYTVSNNSSSGAGSLSLALSQAQTDPSAVIDINSGLPTITLSGALPAIQNNLVINGNGAMISGANAFRIFFVNAAGDSVQLNALGLSAGLAVGGAGGGGNGGGGGGAGLGGAIFLNAGSLTVNGVVFSNNTARGGAGAFGGGNSGSGGGGGGGGGLTTNGGAGGAGSENNGETFQGPGGGGGALTSPGAAGNPNASRAGTGGGVNGGLGGLLILGAGNAPDGGSPALADGGGGGGGFTLDTGAGHGGSGGNGSDFGGGGGAGSSVGGNSGAGGNGGFGSGGGGGSQSGGNGGTGGSGGFGGGGGGGGTTDSPFAGSVNGLGGSGGFGGGAGQSPGVSGAIDSYGGGGLGAGGAVFARAGSSLIVQDSSFSADSVGGGSSGGGSGSAIGQAMFLGTNVNYSVSAGIITVADSIGGGNDPNGSGGLTKSGVGTLEFSGAESYVGSTTVSGGKLELLGNTLASSTISISLGAVLQYNDSVNTYQTPATYTGAGTLRASGSGNLIFGAFGTINVDLSPGGVVDVESGELTGSSSYGGNWTANQGSLNIAGGATFNAVEAGTTGTMQIDALTGAGAFLGGYFANSGGGLSTVTIGVAGGSGAFSGVLEDNPSARLGIVKNGAGTETFSGVNTYSGGTTVNAGTLVVGAAGGLPDNSLSITGGKVQLGTGTGLTALTSLSITGGGVMDVGNNHVILSYGGSDPASTIYSYLQSGYNGGAWNGAGINSSIAALSANNANYGVGFVDGKDGIPGADSSPGVPLTSGQILIAYALYGDVNLDGLVNATDFAIFGANFNSAVTGWEHGDFAYSGLINATDFALLGANFGKSASGTAIDLPASDFAALDAFAAANGISLANVPEPTSMGIIVLGAMGMIGFRRRRCCS